MALFDGYFSPQAYGGVGGGLLDMLRAAQMQTQPSQGFADSSYSMGNTQVPVFGQPEVTGQASIPQNAQLTQGRMPAPQPDLGSRLSAGFEGFANARGLLPALAGAARGFSEGVSPQNQTVGALVQHGLDPETAKTVARDPALMRAVLPQLIGVGGRSSDITEYEYARRQGFTGSFADWMARKRAGAGEFGLNPVWGVDKDGNPVALQLGKTGEARTATLPEGVKIARDPIKLDAGTEWILLDPQTRQPVGRQPKNLAGAEIDKAAGKATGEAVASLESIKSKMPGLETVVKKLDDLSDKATYTYAGQAVDAARRQFGMEPRESAIARAEYTSIVDNQILPLLRDTFGAQFTEREGATLRQTLGDPNKSPKEKQAVLRAFIEQKRRDVEALEKRTGTAPSAPQASGSDGWTDIGGGVRIRKKQ